MSQLGFQLRDAALAQSANGRAMKIAAVRQALMARQDTPTAYPDWTLTGDDVMDVCEALGLMDGDRRWTANCLKGWSAVTPTDRYVPSRRPVNHARPVRVWRWTP